MIWRILILKNNFSGGVGGIQTLVQTSNTQAFYMLILLLVFDWRQRADTQLPTYLLNSVLIQFLFT